MRWLVGSVSRPLQWTFTDEALAARANDDYMSYFPIMVPTFVLPLVRELVEDAMPGKTFTDWVFETTMFSQFDLFLRVAHLVRPELYEWIGA